MGIFSDLDKKLTDNLYAHGNDLIDPAAELPEKIEERVEFLMPFSPRFASWFDRKSLASFRSTGMRMPRPRPRPGSRQLRPLQALFRMEFDGCRYPSRSIAWGARWISALVRPVWSGQTMKSTAVPIAPKEIRRGIGIFPSVPNSRSRRRLAVSSGNWRRPCGIGAGSNGRVGNDRTAFCFGTLCLDLLDCLIRMLPLSSFRTAFTLPYFMGSPPDTLFPVRDRPPDAVHAAPDSSRAGEHVEHVQLEGRMNNMAPAAEIEIA